MIDGSKKEKNVFVLGAGFSRYAGFPLQSELLTTFTGLGLLDAPLKTIEIFADTLAQVKKFIEQFAPKQSSLPLEDVFTLLDQTIARRETCVGLDWITLDETREALKRALLFSIHHASTGVRTVRAHLYTKFAAWLCAQRVEEGIDSDRVSVISLNWDSLLEDSLYTFIRQTGLTRLVDVDYCCYSAPLTDSTPHTPSTLQKAMGIYNLKLLKLHGSANWLHCPTCNRIFTAVGCPESVWDVYVNPRSCPKCRSPNIYLEPYMVTPTYMKVFDNTHIQSIWQNAYVELSEATSVTFVGYSLPTADYHVRTLLRRAIQTDTKIEVILAPHDEATPRVPKRFRAELSGSRYREFFSTHDLKIRYSGAEAFFRSKTRKLKAASLEKNIHRLLKPRIDKVNRLNRAATKSSQK